MEKPSSRRQKALEILTGPKLSHILPRFYHASNQVPHSHSLTLPLEGSGRELAESKLEKSGFDRVDIKTVS